MDKYIITEEEQETVKLYTARSLPDSPSERGMTPLSIKTFFWKFLEPLFKVLNEHLGKIESGITNAVSEHDAGELAHEYIRKIIKDLQVQVTELKALRVDTDVKSHNISVSAHSDIRQAAASALEKAINAYNLASGKAKIFPVKDVSQMLSQLSEGLNIGDKFVLSDKNVPDFTLFEKNSVSEDAILISDGTEFIPGESYLYNGYLLVASESGIDTSLFAKQSDFSQLEKTSTQLSNRITNNEIKYEELESSKEPFDLENNTVYIAKEPITDLVLDFNEGIFSLIFEIDASFSNADESHKIELNYDAGELRYVGGAPDFQAGETWELNIMNGIVTSGRVVSE